MLQGHTNVAMGVQRFLHCYSPDIKPSFHKTILVACMSIFNSTLQKSNQAVAVYVVQDASIKS